MIKIDPYCELWTAKHEEACALLEETYLDPETGYQVMTELFLKKRGSCCESACRHCPYGFVNKEKDPIR